MIINRVMDFIYVTHSHRITQWNPAVLNPGFLEQHAAAMAVKGAALDNYFGSPNRVNIRGLYIMGIKGSTP